MWNMPDPIKLALVLLVMSGVSYGFAVLVRGYIRYRRLRSRPWERPYWPADLEPIVDTFSRYLKHRPTEPALARYLAEASSAARRFESARAVEKEPESAPGRLEAIVKEKRAKFVNIPSVAFHYADEDQIKAMYDDYFKEPTVESLVSEVIGTINGEVKASLPQIIESKIGSKDLRKWISTMKLPEPSVSAMFLQFQRETIKSGQVTLGIEEVEIELSEVVAFEEAVEALAKRFGLELGDDVVESQRTHLKEKAAERTLVKLEQATGWVLVEGRFRIEEQDDFYRCSYQHPVTEYLSENVGPVTISVLIPKAALEPHVAGNYAQSIGRQVPLRIYGQVWEPIDRKGQMWDLTLTPLAIY
jgi:hypothetical protein